MQEATILDLQAAMDQGQITARELALFYLSRIGQIDQCEDGLNAVLEVNPEALYIANMLDAERKQGVVRSALHGIPIMLKDTINTADVMHTSAGSLALADNLAPYDAHVVTRLRQAGAIVLGKTNMTEFANFMGQNMPAGYSSRGGQVLSPYNRACSPSGSRPAPPSPWPPACARPHWGRRTLGRSTIPRRPMASWASSRRWGW